MGGFGVFAWLAIGVAAGRVVSRLMVGAEDDALRARKRMG
jgi:heme exporter protein D